VNNLGVMRLFRSLVLFFLLAASLLGLSSCHAQHASEAALNEQSNEPFFFLDLIGYNYTDNYIDSYSVDGQGGGNIMASSPTSGGSGIACCVKLSKDTVGTFRVRVRWQYGGCTYTTKSQISGSVFENIHPFFKKTEVEVRLEAGMKPKYLEVHFYQDGSVQAQLSEDPSRPRLVMDEERADKTSFPKCKDDKKPL
jgi:hypothetical protein